MRTTSSGQYRRVELVRGAVHDVGAVLEHDDLVGQTLGLEEQVRAHHHGGAVAGHLPDQLEHGVRRLGVEARRRLVVEQQVGPVEDRPGQGQARLHPGRVAADLVVEGGVDAEAVCALGDAGVDIGRRGPGRGARRSSAGCPTRRGGRRATAWPTRRRSGTRTASPSTAGSSPNTRTEPASGAKAPVIMRMAVVLPAPFGPRSTVISPAGTRRSSEVRAGWGPKDFTTPSRAMTGGSGSIGATVDAAGLVIVGTGGDRPRPLLP